ncbi:MAG: hypothetical protein ABH856_04505 [Patescibacteria group bacterium]|nr:hypothetical protein [Patescibacteria group bacterium]
MAELTDSEKDLLSRKTHALHVFSDTIPESEDFDAPLTTDYNSYDIRSTRDGIGESTVLGQYGIELIVQLVDGLRGDIAAGIGDTDPDLRAIEKSLTAKVIKVVGNNAPRDGESENGTDFHLAITDNDLIVIATPLELLSFIRDRIKSVFRFPNKDNPIWDWIREQFRSAKAARIVRYPDHLVRENKLIIPDQRHLFELAFADRYGNPRARARDKYHLAELIDQKKNGSEVVGLRVVGTSKIIRTSLTNCLDGIPAGEWGLYQNVADNVNGERPSAYWEFAPRWASGDQRLNGYEILGRPKLGSPIEVVSV